MKIVINKCFGGFGLSNVAIERYNVLSGKEVSSYYDRERNDPHLVQVVEEMGDLANSNYSELKVVEIPDDVSWHIHEYDGLEHVAENHRTWG